MDHGNYYSLYHAAIEDVRQHGNSPFVRYHVVYDWKWYRSSQLVPSGCCSITIRAQTNFFLNDHRHAFRPAPESRTLTIAPYVIGLSYLWQVFATETVAYLHKD